MYIFGHKKYLLRYILCTVVFIEGISINDHFKYVNGIGFMVRIHDTPEILLPKATTYISINLMVVCIGIVIS